MAAGTIGTGPAGVGTPRPSASIAQPHHAVCRCEPEGAAAGEHESVHGHRLIAGPNASVSRVPGAPPRTSTTAWFGSGNVMTVTPVRACSSV